MGKTVQNHNKGWILVGCVLLGASVVFGSGDAAYVTFHCKGVGDGRLDFDPTDTMLLDLQGGQMPYDAFGGSVTQYAQRSVGGVLVPTNKLSVLTPYLALLGLVGAVTVAVTTTRRRKV